MNGSWYVVRAVDGHLYAVGERSKGDAIKAVEQQKPGVKAAAAFELDGFPTPYVIDLESPES